MDKQLRKTSLQQAKTVQNTSITLKNNPETKTTDQKLMEKLTPKNLQWSAWLWGGIQRQIGVGATTPKATCTNQHDYLNEKHAKSDNYGKWGKPMRKG